MNAAQSAFLSALTVAARVSEKKTGIPAAFVIAEGILESSWGTSELARMARNLWGVKADPSWAGAVYDLPTKEHLNGKDVIVPARWRSYPSWLDAMNDHALFFTQNPRYAAALKTIPDTVAFTHAIAAAGYATDPDYANKIITLMRQLKL